MTAGAPRATLEARLDAPDDQLPVAVNDTRQFCDSVPPFTSLSAPIKAPAGSHCIYLVARAVDAGPATNPFKVTSVEFASQRGIDHMHTSKRFGTRAAATLLAGLALAVLVGVGTAQAHDDDWGKRGSIDRDQISIQMFNFLAPIIGGFPPPNPPLSQAQLQSNVRGVFATLRRIGYRRFENFFGTWGWTPEEYRKVFRSHDLRAVADHGDLNPATFDARLDQAKALGVEYVGSGGWPPPGNMNTLENALAVARNLNELGRRARARGLKVYGHNHDAEFRTKLDYDVNGDGFTEKVPAIEVVMLNTDPRYVTFEIDVHWAYEGLGHEHFGDLVYFLQKYARRISQLHVKGTAHDGAMTDVGTSTDITDWESVFRAARYVDYYHFEYDFPPDPVASAENAYRFLRRVRF